MFVTDNADSFRQEDFIKIILVEDHPVYRNGLKQCLERDPELKVIAEFTEGKEVIKHINTIQPDVILSDYRLNGDMDGIQLLRNIKANNIDIRVILLTAYDNEDLLLTSISAGIDGYLLKDADSSEIARSIKAVISGGAVLSPSLTRKIFPLVIQSTSSKKENVDRSELTQREKEVFWLLKKGYSDKEIAKALHISIKTVHNHNTRIFRKLNVTSRRQLI